MYDAQLLRFGQVTCPSTPATEGMKPKHGTALQTCSVVWLTTDVAHLSKPLLRVFHCGLVTR